MGSITIDDRDPSIQYVGDWSLSENPNAYMSTSRETSSIGAHAIFKFKGSSVSVYGILLRFADKAPTTGYRIDGSTTAPFKGSPREDIILYRKIFYMSPQLDPLKEHTLNITLTATGGNPFHLDYLVVTGAGATTPSPSPSSSTTNILPPSMTISPSPTLSSSISSSFTLPRKIDTTVVRDSPTTTYSLVTLPDPSSSSASSAVALLPTENATSRGLSSGTIVNIVVGSILGVILLVIVTVLLFWVSRRRAKARNKKLSSNYQGTMAFRPPVNYNSVASSSSHLSPAPPFGSGAGYVVRGGSSQEKMAHGLSYEGQIDRDEVISMNLPTYQSAIGNAVHQKSLSAAP